MPRIGSTIHHDVTRFAISANPAPSPDPHASRCDTRRLNTSVSMKKRTPMHKNSSATKFRIAISMSNSSIAHIQIIAIRKKPYAVCAINLGLQNMSNLSNGLRFRRSREGALFPTHHFDSICQVRPFFVRCQGLVNVSRVFTKKIWF